MLEEWQSGQEKNRAPGGAGAVCFIWPAELLANA